MKLRLVAFATLSLVAAVSLGTLQGGLADVSPVGAAVAHHCPDEPLKHYLACAIPDCVPGDLECDYHGPL